MTRSFCSAATTIPVITGIARWFLNSKPVFILAFRSVRIVHGLETYASFGITDIEFLGYFCDALVCPLALLHSSRQDVQAR